MYIAITVATTQLVVWSDLSDCMVQVLCNKKLFFTTQRPGAHNRKELSTLYYQLVPAYDQNPLTFLSRNVHIWSVKPSHVKPDHTTV